MTQSKALNEWLRYFMLIEANNNNTGENIQQILEKIDEEQKNNKGKGVVDAVNNYANFNNIASL